MKPLLSTQDLSDGEIVSCNVDGLNLLVGSAEGRYFAIEDLCPHAYVAFGHPHLIGDEIVCPWHGLTFNVHSGECAAWTDLEELRRFPVEERDGVLYWVTQE